MAHNVNNHGSGRSTPIEPAIEYATDTARRTQTAQLLSELAKAVFIRFEHTRNVADLEWTVLLYAQLLKFHPTGDPHRAASLEYLADAVRTRFQQSRNHADLNRAVLLNQELLELRPPGHPDRSSSLNDLGTMVLTRFEQSGHTADLDRAVLLFEQALELRPPGHPRRPGSLINLASAVWARFGQSGHRADLGKAILLYEQGLELHPPGHPNHSISLNNLAAAVLRRFHQSGNPADLDKAVVLFEQALELRPSGHPYRSSSLNNFASVVWTRFQRSGNPADLDRAVLLFEQALVLHPLGHPHRPTSLNNLGSAVSARFQQSGNRSDLDRAVLLLEQGLELCPPGHPNRSMAFINLGTVILKRFEQSQHHADLDRVVLLFDQALELRPPGHPGRPKSLTNLATVISRRFQQSGHRKDLERAILLHGQALDLHPPGHPDRSLLLSNLATALWTRFGQSKDDTDLDRAILLHEQALELLPPGHSRRSKALISLVTAVLRRFKQSEHSPDLEQALYYCRDGLETTSQTDIYRSDLFSLLGRVHAAKLCSNGLLFHIEQALDAFSRGASAQFSPLSSRFSAATEWLGSAIVLRQYNSAIAACRISITLLPQLLWLELDLESRLAALKGARGRACDGAACAIRESEVATAIELLEGGRGVFWTHTLQLNMPHDDLPLSYAQKLAHLSHALRAATLDDSSLKEPRSPQWSAAENVRRRELVVEWSQTLEEIHSTTGYERFLLPRPFNELAEAAKHGPIVVLNASQLLGCDAMVIKSPRSPPEHVALSSMTYGRLQRLRAGLQSKTGRDTARYMELAVPESDLNFRDILEELWTSVVKPIVESLGLEQSDNPGRLWWCPTNLFTFIPVHAAGIYQAGGSISISDYAVSSYIPTLDALITTRSHAMPTRADKILVIIQPETPGLRSLPYTVQECKRIQKVVPPEAFLHLDESNHSAMDGSDATVENVLSRLPEASIVHFACHGTQSKDPLQSALHLQDGQLTLDRIIHRDLPNASIAFLSACHSAAGDQEQPDEAIHVGAAMLAAGYQSVIATMWSMGDIDGPLVAEEVYTTLFSSQPDPTRVAHALHVAVRKLRETGADFAAWVPFIHLGV